jgi:outer membrane protein TolC
MKKRLLYALVLFISFRCGELRAQSQYSLSELVGRARELSLSAKIARNSAMSGYWTYTAYRASLYPYVYLSGTLPSYQRSISKITLPNGSDVFVGSDQAYNNVNLNVNQNVGLTGGQFSVYSSLNRIDVFSPGKSRQYSTVPFSISYSQNSLFYNPYKWERQIAPMQLEETKKTYVEDMEGVALNTVDVYFRFLSAQNQLIIDWQNFLNADTLLKITQTKFNIGTRNKNDLLQARLNQLNARNNYTQDIVAKEQARQLFVQFFRLNMGDSVRLTIPEQTDLFAVDLKKALSEAEKNRQKVVEFRRRRLLAEQNLRKTISDASPTLNITANLGASQTSPQLLKSYANLQQQQSFWLQFSIPLLDWGVNRSRIKKARADLELAKSSIEQEKEAFEQEIVFQIMQWNALKDQLETSRETMQIGLERLEIAKQRYILGSINFTEFNEAQQQKVEVINVYINNLRSYWNAYYQIRRLTLYDFVKQSPIRYESSPFTAGR